jgi:biopolymer transport protein ExbB
MKFTALLRHVAAASLLGVAAAHAQSFDQAIADTTKDLKVAVEELAAAQKQVAEEKIPLAQKLNDLEAELLKKRKELEDLSRRGDNQLVDLNRAKSELKARNDEVTYVSGLLNEYLRAFETRIHIAEVKRYQQLVDAAKTASETADITAEQKLTQQLALIDASLGRLEALLGGDTFAGSALSPKGQLETGKFTVLGPLAVFANDKGDVAGVVELIPGSPEPSVLNLGPDAVPGIKAITGSGAGTLKLDTTLGNALKVEETKDGFIEHIIKGGVVMYPIVGVALLGLVIAIIKWGQLATVRIATPMDVQKILNFLEKSDHAKAMQHAQSVKGPTGRLLVAAVEHANEKKEYIEEVLYEVMLDVKPKLEKFIPMLALVAAAAPLLGLLGTVTGMITTFNMISVFGTGDPKTLSGGISEALITTECGLYVAIPALISQALLNRKVKSILGAMEQLSVSFINGVPEREENPFNR